MALIANHKNYKVLTPSGNRFFSHVQKFTRQGYIHIQFDDGTELKVSPKHPFIVNGKKKLAYDLSCDDVIDGKPKTIFHIDFVDEEIELFDLLNVENGNLYYTNDLVSHNCDFLQSSGTLIDGEKLRLLTYSNPIESNSNGFKVYEAPIEDHKYMLVCDVSRGVGKDFHAFSVLDITKPPYKQVATFRNNELSPLVLPSAIYPVLRQYNNAFALIEVNDIGAQVADILKHDMEYPNILGTAYRGRKGQVLGEGFGNESQNANGIRTTVPVKRIGCSLLKSLIVEDKLVINDYWTIDELTTFVATKESYEAEKGHHDDLVMTLVLFSWATSQEYFRELLDTDIRKAIYENSLDRVEEEMTPFGFIEYGDSIEDTFVDDSGTVWTVDNESTGNWWDTNRGSSGWY